MSARTAHGEVVKLDRGLPLVELEDGKRLRCEHAAALQKHGHVRACIGDRVEVELPDTHEVGVIEKIEDRESILSRKDPNDRATGQILAANFDKVLIVQPIDRFNPTRLQRELVMAHQSNATVGVLLTTLLTVNRIRIYRAHTIPIDIHRPLHRRIDAVNSVVVTGKINDFSF